MKSLILKQYNTIMKELFLGLFLSVITILAPIKVFVITTLLFVFFDTIFAIYATIKLNGVSSFRSNKLFNVVVKSVFYFSGILLAFLVDKYIFEGSILEIKLLITKAVSLLFIYIEVKSLDETSIKVGNKSLWVVFKALISNGKELKEDLGDIIDK